MSEAEVWGKEEGRLEERGVVRWSEESGVVEWCRREKFGGEVRNGQRIEIV